VALVGVAQQRQERPRGEHDAEEVHGEHALPLRAVARHERAAARDPGVVEEQVDGVGAELGHGRIPEPDELRLVGDVGDGRRDASRGRPLCGERGGLRQRVVHDVAHRHVAPLGGELAHELAAAGLRRINVSLDSLQRDRFLALTKRDELARVLDGIDAARDAGLSPLKLNVVVMRGVNDDEVVDLARFGRDRGLGVRFIEFMPLDAQGEWSADKVVPAREILERIDAVFPLERATGAHVEPAERFAYRDGAGDVGVIASVTEPFCESCDRVRVTAEGQFRTCLFALDETDLRAVLRAGRGLAEADLDDRLGAAIAAAVGTKWAGHHIGRVDFVRPGRSMSQIGG